MYAHVCQKITYGYMHVKLKDSIIHVRVWRINLYIYGNTKITQRTLKVSHFLLTVTLVTVFRLLKLDTISAYVQKKKKNSSHQRIFVLLMQFLPKRVADKLNQLPVSHFQTLLCILPQMAWIILCKTSSDPVWFWLTVSGFCQTDPV